jgi:hypothetical protein
LSVAGFAESVALPVAVRLTTPAPAVRLLKY